MRSDRAGQLIEQLEQAGAVDSSGREEGQKLPKELGWVSGLLADNGYANGAEVDKLEREAIEVLVATDRGEARQYDFRPPRVPKDPPANSQPWIKRVKQRTETERGRKKYRLR